MAVSSGTCYTNYVSASGGNTRLKFEWWIDSYSPVKIGWRLVTEKTNSGYRTMHNYNLKINGSTVSSRSTSMNIDNGKLIASGTTGVGASFSCSISAGIGTSSTNASGSGSWDLALQAYFAVQPREDSKTERSMNIYYKPDRNINQAESRIRLHGLNTWSAWSGLNVISGNWNTTAGCVFQIGWYEEQTESVAGGTWDVQMRIQGYAGAPWTESNVIKVTLHDLPHCACPDFTIGETLELDLINPLHREVKAYMIYDNGEEGGSFLGDGSTAHGIVYGWDRPQDIDYLYSTIPNKQQGEYRVKVVWGAYTKITSGKYKVNPSECSPLFNDFDVVDSNSVSAAITGGNAFIKGVSTVRVNIPAAKKMEARRHATPNQYYAYFGERNQTIPYSEDATGGDVGVINESGTQRIFVRAEDSREIGTTVYKDITVMDYSKPTVAISAERANNFEDETTIKVEGTYTRLTVDGEDKNTIQQAQYRYRTSDSEEWSNWFTLAFSASEGRFTCADAVRALDKTDEFIIEVKISDKLDNNTAQANVIKGIPIFFISSNEKKCYINNQEIIMYTPVAQLDHGKTIVLNDNNFWDTAGIVHNGQNLKDMLATEKKVLTASEINVYDFWAKKYGNVVQLYCSGANKAAWNDWFVINGVLSAVNSLPESWRKGMVNKPWFPLFVVGAARGNIQMSVNKTTNEVYDAWVRVPSGTIVANSEINFSFTWIVDD